MPLSPIWKKRFRLLLKIGLSVVIAFAFLEVMLRIVPLKVLDYQSTFQYEGDKELGFRPLPHQDAAFHLNCLRNPHLRTNSEGMRGDEWETKRSPKIALLGDSFLAALTISDQFHLTKTLQAHTGGEIWNAGVSGYGTYQELLIWRKLIAPRRPDITVLFMFLENDIRDNHCGLCRAEGQPYCPCLEVSAGAIKERMDFEVRQPEQGLKAWLLRNCLTCRLVRNLRRDRDTKPASGIFFDKESFAYNIYRPGLGHQWEEGWQGTEWTLRQLKQECDAIGSKLLIVNVPGLFQLANDWQAEMAEQIGTDSIPSDFKIDYPIQRLQTMADSAGIALLDMQPAFLQYRDQHHLQKPWFGWCCDGHWNPVGHRLAADLVHNRLTELGWVNSGEAAPTPAPEAIMGTELMQQVYGCETVDLE
ncbi:MAG: SGNH/GDSL hydrolase family protein [Bacteroidia bacterium]